jgi:hypothetical protein
LAPDLCSTSKLYSESLRAQPNESAWKQDP